MYIRLHSRPMVRMHDVSACKKVSPVVLGATLGARFLLVGCAQVPI